MRIRRRHNHRAPWRRWAVTASLLLAVALLVACGSAQPPLGSLRAPEATDAPTLAPSIALEATEWLLTSLRGQGPVEGTEITIGFHPDEYLQGFAGCNSFGADYAVAGQAFELGELHRTRFACDVQTDVLDREAALFEALQAIAAYQASEVALVFRAADGETIMTFARKVPPPVDPALAGRGWVLVALRGESLVEGPHISLSFDQEGAGGYSGCNRYGGQYKVADDGSLRLVEIAVTAMECELPEGVMDQEQAYLEALRPVESYALVDERLELRDAEGQTVLVYDRQQETNGDPAELVGTAWRLVSLDGEAPLEGSTLSLAFRDERRASGDAGCRDYFAMYEAEGGELNFLSKTMMGTECAPSRLGDDEALMRQEGEYTTMLGWTDRYQLSGDQLELFTIRGETLVYERLPAVTLEGPTWSLLAFVEPSPHAETENSLPPFPAEVLPRTKITAIFGEGGLEGSAGCNHYGAMAKRDGPSLRVSDLYFTEMACLEPAGVMEQEQRYLTWLADITTAAIQGRRLWLATGDGRALVFTVQE